jgi:hypothetical protein
MKAAAFASLCVMILRPGAAQQRVPVLLELFTSEGCSSCPPADRLLAEFDRLQPVPGAQLVVLSEHVDYWDRLGWKDPFSAAQFTARQEEYAARFHVEGPYTPQLVVDGRWQLVGSDSAGALSAIRQALREVKIPMDISGVARRENRVTARIHLGTAPRKIQARLYVAVAEDAAESRVLRGENAGRSLTHVAVVRALHDEGAIRVGDPADRDFEVPVTVRSGNRLRLVVFLQESSGRILGLEQRMF